MTTISNLRQDPQSKADRLDKDIRKDFLRKDILVSTPSDAGAAPPPPPADEVVAAEEPIEKRSLCRRPEGER